MRHAPGRPLILALGPDPIGRCPRCWLLPERCACHFARRSESSVRVVIVRHWKESLKSANSARLAPLVLADCTIVDHGRQGAEFDGTSFSGDGAWLLYPPSPDASPPDDAVPPRVRTLVVPDGTWAQTRRMVRRVPGLAALPRFGVQVAARSAPRVLTPPNEWAVSTLEAIGHALLQLGEESAGRALLDLYDGFAAHSRWELLRSEQRQPD